MNTTPNPAGPHPTAGPHTITIAENTAAVVTAELCMDVYRGEFNNHAEAAEYAQDYARDFPWGWTCSCGLGSNGCRTAAEAAFHAPDEDRHFAGEACTVVVLVVDDTAAGGASA